LSLIASTVAQAQIDPHLGQTVMGKTVTVKVTGTSALKTVDLGTTFGTESAGRIDITLSYKNQANQTLSVLNLPVFCTDLYQAISLNTPYADFKALDAVAGVFPVYNANNRVDASQMLALEYLYGSAFGTTANYFSSVTNGSWSSNKLAGFQVALWEIAMDTYKNSSGVHTFTLSNGNIYNTVNLAVSQSVENYARGFLTDMRNALNSGTGPKIDLLVLTNANKQDLLLPYDPFSPLPPIPEPSTYALFGALSLAGIVALRKRISRG
jgi:hypothetical protein